jgi:hypothetical protein
MTVWKKERNEEIAGLILSGEKISDVSRRYGITQVRGRQILHTFCKRTDRAIYESLRVPYTYKDSNYVYFRLPKLDRLREHKDYFIFI